MLIDKTHLGWGLGSAAFLGVATVGFVLAGAGPGGVSGGSVAGLTFGALSLAMMTFAGLLAVRKKFPAVRLGSAQFWLRGHIWLGLLSLPLAFYHSNFRFGGALEQVFMIVLLVVIASGVFGLAMQQFLPRLLKVRAPLETFPQQIPYLCQKFQEEGDQLIKELQGSVKKAGPPPAAAEGGDAPAPSAAKAMLAAKAAAAKAAAVAPSAETDDGLIKPTAPTKPKSDVAAAILAAKAAKAAKATTAADSTPEKIDGEPGPAKPKSAALAAILAAKAAKAAADNSVTAANPSTEPAPTPAKPSAEKPPVAVKPALPKAAPTKPDVAMPRLELLTRFYQERVTPFLSSDPLIAARQELASENYARMAFANLAVDLPSQAIAAVQRLEEMVAERRQFLVQVRIQNWLRSWLLIHVPLSAALFVLAALHVITALRVVPWF